LFAAGPYDTIPVGVSRSKVRSLKIPRRSSRLGALLLAWLAAAIPLSAQEITVDVTVNLSAESVRLVLTHSQPVSYAIEASAGRLRIRYAEPVTMRPPGERIDDPILERYKLRDGRTLYVYTGDDYASYETFELHNPFRLVLDLRGKSGGERPAERPRARVALPETVIVIDPGHGGAEHGAVGPSGLMEKEVALVLARSLKRSLERLDRSISVVLTRDEDRALGLDERTAVANHNRADLFLSIHLNASPRSSAQGAETYYLSTGATDDEARILAALENRSAGKARPDERVGQGSLDLVLWDLAQNQYLAESSALAEALQRHLNELTGTRDRGVRQAPFRVLMGAMMPAILVEVGFISNPEEESLLYTAAYRESIVEAMTAAVREFLLDLERYSGRTSQPAPADRR
jgi:N-acetylmuramoyl-L-alanine amidase